MKRLGIATLIVGAWANTAIAETFDWSGIYGGVSVGARWSSAQHSFPFQWDDTESSRAVDITGVGFIGYNFSVGRWVFGPEASVMFSDTEGKGKKVVINGCDCFEQKTLRTSAAASVNGRVGYAFGSVLPFVTAGFSRSWYKSDINRRGLNRVGPEVSYERNGWNIGAGTDWAISDSLFARAEYRFIDLGKDDISNGWSVRYRQHAATLGIGYKF